MHPDAPLGLETGTAVVVPYDPRWPGLFEDAAAELSRAVGPSILSVHHVGSTSVPGLCAKPILDLLVSIPDFDGGLDLVEPLDSIGYEFVPGEEIPDRHYFRRRIGTIRTHHLSLAEPTSRHHRVTLAFRDALRADRSLADAYAALKLELAERFPLDRVGYTDGKTAFVVRTLVSAGLV